VRPVYQHRWANSLAVTTGEPYLVEVISILDSAGRRKAPEQRLQVGPWEAAFTRYLIDRAWVFAIEVLSDCLYIRVGDEVSG